MSIVAFGIIGFGLLNVQGVQAQTTSQTNNLNPFQLMIERISSVFHLDKAKVQEVVQQVHTEQQATREKQMEQRQTDRLSQLVKDGKITEAQKSAIIAKLTEIKKTFNPEISKTLSQAERKTVMDKHQAELKAWAVSQGIDPSYVMRGFGGRQGIRGIGERKMKLTPTP